MDIKLPKYNAELTPRQKQVLGIALEKPRTYRQIGEEIGITENTVKNHLSNICTKFDIRSVNQLLPIPKVDVELSFRQKQVIAFLKKGQSNKQIAFELSIADATVRQHVRQVIKKLQLRSRWQLKERQ